MDIVNRPSKDSSFFLINEVHCGFSCALLEKKIGGGGGNWMVHLHLGI